MVLRGGERNPLARFRTRDGFDSSDVPSSSRPLSRDPQTSNPVDPDWEEEPQHPQKVRRPYKTTVLDENWDSFYLVSEKWGDWWKVVSGRQTGEWPKDLKVHGNKMYFRERLCVPESLVLRAVQAQHRLCGHLGVDRLFEECIRRLCVADEAGLKAVCRRVKGACSTCAQCDPPNRRRYGQINRFPIPMRIWDSVSMDVFSMPEAVYKGELFDAMLLCVDRHTGWIIAIPTQKTGLTSERAVDLLLQKWTDLGGGIPSVITSDQGSQFVGAWFRTMCARLGIRQAFSQAYRAQANGRAERAGRQLIDWLEKLNTDAEINWVQSLPAVLRQYHDSVGESGFSPYEIVFGRFRNLPGIPHRAPGFCEDAWDFLDRQERVDERVAEILNTKHQLAVDRVNRNRAPRPHFSVGTKVWVYKHKRVGGYKLEPRWWGPATIEKRVGESSYVVAWEGGTQDVHIDDLKEYAVDEFEGDSQELWYICRERSEEEEEEEGNWAVENVLGHRTNSDGILEFQVRWLGWSEEHDSWEPASHFTRCCKPWVEYCDGKGLEIRARDLLERD